MIGFLFFFAVMTCCILAVIFGTADKRKGPKGKKVRDAMKANWIKEKDEPEEPLDETDYWRMLRSYNVSLNQYPAVSTCLYMVAFILLFIGWYVDFNIAITVLEIIGICVCIVIHVSRFFKNRNILEQDTEEFTKKYALLVDTKQSDFLGRTSTYTMRLGLCNRDGEPRIYTIPIRSDLYAIASKLDKYEVIMFRGRFSAMMAFITDEELEEQLEEQLKEQPKGQGE